MILKDRWGHVLSSSVSSWSSSFSIRLIIVESSILNGGYEFASTALGLIVSLSVDAYSIKLEPYSASTVNPKSRAHSVSASKRSEPFTGERAEHGEGVLVLRGYVRVEEREELREEGVEGEGEGVCWGLLGGEVPL